MKMKRVPSKSDLLCFVTIYLDCHYFLYLIFYGAFMIFLNGSSSIGNVLLLPSLVKVLILEVNFHFYFPLCTPPLRKLLGSEGKEPFLQW